MKRMITILAVVALVMTFMVPAVFADEGTVVSISNVTALPGSEVSVDVSISGNTGFDSFGIYLTYDDWALTLTKIEAGSLVSGAMLLPNLDENGAGLMAMSTIEGDGVLFTATFSINEYASGPIEIALDMDKTLISLVDTDLTITPVAGSVTADPCMYGHVKSESNANVSEPDENGNVTVTYLCANCWEPIGEPFVAAPGSSIHNPFNMEYNLDLGYLVENWESEEQLTNTVEVAPGQSVVYGVGGCNGYELVISGGDITATLYGYDYFSRTEINESYEDVDGAVTIPVALSYAYVTITNNGTEAVAYDLSVKIPVGDIANPQVLVDGENTVKVPVLEWGGYYTSYTPSCNGTLTVTVAGDNWSFCVNSYGDPDSWRDDIYGDQHSAYDEVPVNTEMLEVKAGYPIEIIIACMDANYTSLEGELTITVEFVPTHTWDDGVETTPATCTKEGEMTHTCTICGETKVEPIAIVDHTPAIDAAVAATCTATGLTEGSHCSVCGKVLVAQEVVAKLAHTPAIDAAVAPTCTATGLTEGSHCSVCGEVLVAQEEVGKLEHTWDEGVTTAPSCIAEGELKHTCTVCGATKSEILDKVAHTDADADEVCDVCEADLSNPKDGDIVSVIAGAAFVGLMGVVALPVMKKKFN